MALCAWAGVFQGALHSEAGAHQTLFSQVSREEVGPVLVSHQSTTNSIIYGSAKLQLSRGDAAL